MYLDFTRSVGGGRVGGVTIPPLVYRSIPAKFVRKSEYKGIPAFRYNVTIGDTSTDPSLKCLCINDTFCWKKGAMELLKCSGTIF